jgi:hypothetical protein
MTSNAKKTEFKSSADRERQNLESDAVSFWLLLLFVVTFFGIAAEEARRPSTIAARLGFQPTLPEIRPQAYSIDGRLIEQEGIDPQQAARRRFDLSSGENSNDRDTAQLDFPGKLANPATGK